MIRKTLKILSTFLIIVFLFIVVYILYCQQKNKIPYIFGLTMLRIDGGSMEPTLKYGDYILVKKQNDYRKDDIISYTINASYITHRIVEINGDKYITKGDANNSVDEATPKSSVAGKVIFSIKKKNMIGVILLSIVAIILSEVNFKKLFSYFLSTKE